MRNDPSSILRMTEESELAFEEHLQLGTTDEYDFDQALFGMSGSAMRAYKTNDEALHREYRIFRAAALQLLGEIEKAHALPPSNIYRQNFRNIMSEVREIRKRI